MEESVAQDWPKTPGGSTDWEVVFEDPETGLIALIAQARSAEALRDCVVVVIKKLFTRETDPPEVERFIGELTQLIPDGTGDQNLTLVLEAVTGILRQIKDDRAKKAAEYEQFKEPAADGEKRGLEEARRKARLRKFFLIFGSGGVGIALSTGLLYLFIGGFLGGGSAEKDQTPNSLAPRYLLIEQMQQVALGRSINTNAFGGALEFGNIGNRAVVVAEGIPPKDCASAAWVFVNRGTVMINGIVPMKISPNILKKLCEAVPGGQHWLGFPRKVDVVDGPADADVFPGRVLKIQTLGRIS